MLAIRQRVDLKVATLVHWSLSGNSASYLADECLLVADARERWLCSTESRTCVVTRYPDPQHLWWQSFCSCWSWAMEQFTATSQRCWFTIQLVPVVTIDIFVWIVGHGAMWSILTVPSRNNLTYLLTYTCCNWVRCYSIKDNFAVYNVCRAWHGNATMTSRNCTRRCSLCTRHSTAVKNFHHL